MPASLSDWSQNASRDGVSLAAGINGLSRSFSGAHTVEKAEFANFLYGNEIVFTTGIALQDTDELTALAKKCFSRGACALALNLGPYIKSVPEELIDYCNKNSFPLFSFPWEVHIETLIQSVYRISGASSPKDLELQSSFENAILDPERKDLYVDRLAERGFPANCQYCVSMIEFRTQKNETALKSLLELVQHHLEKDKSEVFSYISASRIIIIFSKHTAQQVEEKTKKIIQDYSGANVIYSIGRCTKTLSCLYKSYSLAEKMLYMKRNGQLPEHIVSYEELGLYRIIIGLENQDILDQIYKEYFEPLLTYDTVCGTDYTQFVYSYLKYDGRIKDIAAHMFIHKNTVHYKIHKIEEILDCDFSRLDTKMYLMIASMDYRLRRQHPIHS